MARRPVVDAIAAISTGPGKRALEALVVEGGAEARAALTALLATPPTEVKALAFFLAWAGRLALGPVPVRVGGAREALRSVVDAEWARFVAYLDHADLRVAVAATVPLAACRGHADEVQRAFAARAAGKLTPALAAALRIGAAVLARDTRGHGLPRDSHNHADAVARQLDGRGATLDELTDARHYGERALAKLPWFPRELDAVLRALIMEHPLGEREARALAYVAEGPIETRAVELVFAHREVMARGDVRAMMLLRGDELTAAQRTVMAAPTKYPDRGLVGSIRYPAFRVPVSARGRAIVLGRGEGVLAEVVETKHGPTPAYVAILDVLAEARAASWKPARHRAALEAVFAAWSPARRAELDAAVRADGELCDPTAYCELVPGTPWP